MPNKSMNEMHMYGPVGNSAVSTNDLCIKGSDHAARSVREITAHYIRFYDVYVMILCIHGKCGPSAKWLFT